tara:strand:+ start:315 stop:647 length:333 start_codon:yes stop_codon:yes gene_type:complete
MGVKEIEIKGGGDITLYTLPYCNYCNLLKDTLSKLKIPFKEIDVEENEYMGDWIERNLKTESYPVIYFTKRPEEGFYILPSSDLDKLGGNRIFNTIEEALEILLTYYYEI